MAEQTLAEDVTAVLDSPEYAELSLIDITVEYGDSVPFRQPNRIVIEVGLPVGTGPLRITEETQ